MLPDIRADLGLSSAVAGLLTSLPVLCFAVGAPVAAWLGRRVGSSRAVLLGCLAIALLTVLRPYGGAILLLAGTVLIGLAITIGNVLLPVVVKRDFGSSAGPITGVLTASLAAGAALAAAVTAPLAGLVGWRHALAAGVLLALAASALWWGVTRRTASTAPPAATPTRAPTRGGLWTHPVAWAVTAFLGCQSATYYSVTAWLPTMLRDTAGLGGADAGLAMSLYQLLGIPGTLLIPVLVRRTADQRALGVSIAVGWLIALTGLLVLPGGWLAWSLLAGVTQGMGISYAFTVLVLRSADSATANRMSGMVQLLGYAVGASGPVLVGLVHGATGSWALALAPVLAAAALLAPAALVGGRDRTVRV